MTMGAIGDTPVASAAGTVVIRGPGEITGGGEVGGAELGLTGADRFGTGVAGCRIGAAGVALTSNDPDVGAEVTKPAGTVTVTGAAPVLPLQPATTKTAVTAKKTKHSSSREHHCLRVELKPGEGEADIRHERIRPWQGRRVDLSTHQARMGPPVLPRKRKGQPVLSRSCMVVISADWPVVMVSANARASGLTPDVFSILDMSSAPW